MTGNKPKGIKGADQPAPDGPARVVKPGDWGAVAEAPLKGFTLNAFAVPGRAAPKPDPAETRIAELEKKLRKAEEAHQAALARAAREADEKAAAAERRGREEGRKEGEKDAAAKYNKSVEDLRKGIRGVLEALNREKAALFLGFEGEAVALAASAVKRMFEGIADGHAEAVLPLLRKAVSALGEVSVLTLKVNPADFQVIDDNRAFWLPVEAGLKDIRILQDARIPKGSCLAESDATSIEMRAGDLADRIGEALSQVFEAKTRAVKGPEAAEDASAPAASAASGVSGADAPSAEDDGEAMPPSGAPA